MPNAHSAATLTIYPGLGHTHTHWCVCVCVRVRVCVWDRYRIMLACIPSGLVYAATQKTRKTSTRTDTHLTALCPGQPG